MHHADMSGCRLCPRLCGVRRARGEAGFCRETDEIRVARAALHMWEEPCISGTAGSGAVFFSGCSLRCVFCQNYSLSRSEIGKAVSPARLAAIFLSLQKQGAGNINLVTGSHFVPGLIRAIALAREQGLSLPVVYNSSAYERVETLHLLEGYVDVYLPDFKFWEKESALRYCARADYPETARLALAEMVRQTGGDADFDSRGLMRRGVIVRHLLLPGHVKEGQQIVSYLHKTYGARIYISLLSQYTPLDTLDTDRFPELSRKVTAREYDTLVNYAIDLGVENGFIQEGDTVGESFIPAFDLAGV